MKQGKLTVTEKDGRVDWKDVVITIDDQSLTLEELATAWRTAHSELATAKQRVKVLERATSMSQQGLAEVHLRNEARLAKRITELETQLAESRRTVLAEVANYIERQSKDPKWSPSSDGELEHFASHLADDVRNDWMAEVEASAEREA